MHFEIIVVDNGSTDDTRSVVEELNKGEEKPVKYTFESRIGISFARNRGAEAARYPILAYLDDDCRVESDWLVNLVSGFDLDKGSF